MTAPVTSASRTVTPSSPATVCVAPPSRSTSPGRSTGCRVISSRTLRWPAPSRPNPAPGCPDRRPAAAPQHGEQHRQHRHRVPDLGRPGPQRARLGEHLPKRGHHRRRGRTGDGGSPPASASWPRADSGQLTDAGDRPSRPARPSRRSPRTPPRPPHGSAGRAGRRSPRRCHRRGGRRNPGHGAGLPGLG